jgi:hypothetical protein
MVLYGVESVVLSFVLLFYTMHPEGIKECYYPFNFRAPGVMDWECNTVGGIRNGYNSVA